MDVATLARQRSPAQHAQRISQGNHRENIQKTICEYYNIKLGDLKAKRRTKNIAIPRQVAMYLCRKHTETSFPAIGYKFGGRDHSTLSSSSAKRPTTTSETILRNARCKRSIIFPRRWL